MEVDIYCDESCPDSLFNKNKHEYMGIGSIWMPTDFRAQFKNDINCLKQQYKVYGEIKWKKVSPNHIEFYKQLIKYYYTCPQINSRIILIEASRLNNKIYHHSDSELGFYKFYYQLLHHWIEIESNYQIFIDLKVNKEIKRIHTLKTVLQNAHKNSNIRNVQALHSHESIGIQISDLLTGLVVSKFNHSITSSAKQSLIEYLENMIHAPLMETTKNVRKLNIFKIKLNPAT